MNIFKGSKGYGKQSLTFIKDSMYIPWTIIMDAEEINYKTLRRIQQSERQSPTLTHIDPFFYKELSRYLQKLQTRLDQETIPQKQMLLHEELQNIKKIAQNIYEHREKKIILAAISKARGGSPALKNMVKEEKTFFTKILELIFDARDVIFEQKTDNIKTQKKHEEIQEKSEPVIKKEESETSISSEKKQETESLEKPTKNTNPIIRIVKEIPQFVGTDTKTYQIRKGDILSIPPDMAKMLEKRHVAQKLNQHKD